MDGTTDNCQGRNASFRLSFSGRIEGLESLAIGTYIARVSGHVKSLRKLNFKKRARTREFEIQVANAELKTSIESRSLSPFDLLAKPADSGTLPNKSGIVVACIPFEQPLPARLLP